MMDHIGEGTGAVVVLGPQPRLLRTECGPKYWRWRERGTINGKKGKVYYGGKVDLLSEERLVEYEKNKERYWRTHKEYLASKGRSVETYCGPTVDMHLHAEEYDSCLPGFGDSNRGWGENWRRGDAGARVILPGAGLD